MDFVFDTYTSGDLIDDSKEGLPPIPAQPLHLPAFNNYREDLTRKFSGLNILKNLQHQKPHDSNGRKDDDIDDGEDSDMLKTYAKASLDMIDSTTHDDITAAVGEDAHANGTTTQSILGARLIRVLNSSNFDSSLRDALIVLQNRIDDGSFKDAKEKDIDITTTSSSVDYAHLTSTGMIGSIARRKLRGEVESDLLRVHFQSLKKSQPVVKKLQAVKLELDDLNVKYGDITDKLKQISQNDEKLKNSVDTLAKQKNAITVKKELLNSFKRNFTLNHYEEHCLTNGDINEEFLIILSKAKGIHENCTILLSLNNPKIGMDLMAKMGRVIDLSTQRIVKYVKSQLGTYFESLVSSGLADLQSNQETQAVFKKTFLFILNENESFFDEIVNDLVQSRSKVVVDDFLLQINGQEFPTRTQQNTTIRHMKGDDHRPLILSSYDSKRFLGDLLAYVHNVLVNERELMESLFDGEDLTQDLKERSNDILDRVIGSLSRPFKSVFERVIVSEAKVKVLQDTYNLLDLYEMMFRKLLEKSQSESPILVSLQSLKQETIDRLFSVADSRLSDIWKGHSSDSPEDQLSDIEGINSDLNLPEWLINFYSEVIPMFDDVVIDDRSFMHLSTELSQKFLKLVVDDVIAVVEAEVKQSKKNSDSKPMVIFKLNCFDFIVSKLITIPIMGGKVELLNGKIHREQEKLQSLQFTLLLQKSGLFDMYNLVNMIFALDNFDDDFDVSIYQPILENQLFTEATFRSINSQLEKFLPNALIDVQQKELMKLLPPLIENEVITNSSIEFVNFYYKISLLVQEYLPVQKGVPIFRWSDSHIATLLGCEEQYSKQKKYYTQE